MKKYQSIVRSDNARTIAYFRENNLLEGKWYATEKIHGANFSIITNGEYEKFASREKDVTNESFHNYREELGDLTEKVKALASKLGADIQVYFEFEGGSIIDTKCKRITYRTNPVSKCFVALDILNLTTGEFLDYPQNYELFKEFDIYAAPVIAEGTFEEVSAINPAIKSRYAIIKDVDAEGIVLKPFKYTKLETGERVLVKCISPLFEENKAPLAEIKAITDDSDKIKLVATMERLGKVAAKIGVTSTEKAKMGTLIVSFKKDIKEDIGEVNEKQLSEISASIVKQFFT